jgi:oligopeptidase B
MSSLPIAPKRPHEIMQHGQVRIDNYYWMRNKTDPETMKYLRLESDYLDEYMQHTQSLQEELFTEMKARIKENNSTVPEKRGGYFYYLRYAAGKQYPIFCRKQGSLDGAEEILLDQNELADGKSFCSVGAFSVSLDETKLVYSVDYYGQEIYTLYVKDLQSGKLYPEVIGNISGSAYERGGVEWANDSQTLFYVTLDETLRPDKLHRHILGTDPLQDVVLFHETDEMFSLFIRKSHDNAFLMLHHLSTITSEIRFLSASHPLEQLKIIQPRIHGLEYFAAHHKGSFFILHNDQSKNFMLSVVPVDNPGMENWHELISHREDVLIEGVDTFEDFLVITERRNGLKQLRIIAPNDVNNGSYVQFPESSYSVTLEANPEFKTNLLRFKYSSLITPNSIIDYHIDTGEWELKKEEEIPSGYDKSQYLSERLFATAADGVMIPISIVYKKGLNRDGSNPTLLYGYGAYGAAIDAAFDSSRISLLDRGFTFAIAHVRGGSDLGHEWYENGKLLHKKNSFTDFIACAEHLIQEGFTSSQKLAIIGASAGGLLVSTCMIMRPDLFKAVICKVPFVDVVTTMSDPSIPLTALEYDQWGNPTDKDHFDYMLSYSPYDNIKSTEYPHMLITTGLNDPRVAYWEAAKFTAKLREMKTDNNLILLYTNYDSGHAGPSGRYDFLKEIALEYAFLIDKLEVRE